MPKGKPRNRPDQSGWARASFEKARKIIYASQTNCAICGRPVDFSKKSPDPWSATLDHIIPISKGVKSSRSFSPKGVFAALSENKVTETPG